jgi:NitT/TauT family transport system ATP-binding protein
VAAASRRCCTRWAACSRGSPVTQPDPHKAAFVFQDYSLLPWKTVIENVELGLVFAGARRAEARKTAEAKLEMVGLSEFAGSRPRHLSGGMQQRVAVARALAMEPAYLLMDEPFGALDEQTRRSLGADLGGRLTRGGQGVVLITHSLEEAIYWADRIIVLSARPGRILKEIRVHGDRPRPLEFMTTPEFTKIRAELFSLIQPSIRAAG